LDYDLKEIGLERDLSKHPIKRVSDMSLSISTLVHALFA
jgi:hypothetical protein